MQCTSFEKQLRIEELHLSFGGLHALNGISFSVNKSEIFSLIGPNGAGKTCVLNSICRFYKPQSGVIRFEGKTLDRFPSHQIIELGIARTFQNIELFKNMSVLDNIKLGNHIHLKQGVFSGGIYLGRTRREEIELRKFIEEKIIDLLEIEAIRKKMVGSLPYGLQKRVELARALASNPKFLLLDEPMAGMNFEEVEDMARFILDITEEWGITILLIEHDMGVVMDISDRICVMNFGEKVAVGTPDEIQNNPEVTRVYLGGKGKALSRRTL